MQNIGLFTSVLSLFNYIKKKTWSLNICRTLIFFFKYFLISRTVIHFIIDSFIYTFLCKCCSVYPLIVSYGFEAKQDPRKAKWLLPSPYFYKQLWSQATRSLVNMVHGHLSGSSIFCITIYYISKMIAQL